MVSKRRRRPNRTQPSNRHCSSTGRLRGQISPPRCRSVRTIRQCWQYDPNFHLCSRNTGRKAGEASDSAPPPDRRRHPVEKLSSGLCSSGWVWVSAASAIGRLTHLAVAIEAIPEPHCTCPCRRRLSIERHARPTCGDQRFRPSGRPGWHREAGNPNSFAMVPIRNPRPLPHAPKGTFPSVRIRSG